MIQYGINLDDALLKIVDSLSTYKTHYTVATCRVHSVHGKWTIHDIHCTFDTVFKASLCRYNPIEAKW